MQYLLSVVHDEAGWSAPAEEMERAFKEVGAFNEELMASGAFVFAGGLTPNTDAKTVEYKDGDVIVTDGPFAETKEQMGGFWVIDVDTHENALEWTRKGSIACRGKVELRPFQGE